MPQSKIVKPWGFEIILTDSNLPYVGKIAFTKAGHRWSLQYHDQKLETFTLLSGQMQLTSGPDKDHLTTIDMTPNFGYTIQPTTIHRLIAITDCVTIESSTPEVGTTFRLEDDYQRQNETEAVRNLPNRGFTSTNQP